MKIVIFVILCLFLIGCINEDNSKDNEIKENEINDPQIKTDDVQSFSPTLKIAIQNGQINADQFMKHILGEQFFENQVITNKDPACIDNGAIECYKTVWYTLKEDPLKTPFATFYELYDRNTGGFIRISHGFLFLFEVQGENKIRELACAQDNTLIICDDFETIKEMIPKQTLPDDQEYVWEGLSINKESLDTENIIYRVYLRAVQNQERYIIKYMIIDLDLTTKEVIKILPNEVVE